MHRTCLAILALVTAATGSAVAADNATPTHLDLQNFEQPLSASGWRIYAWSRSLDAIPASVADVDGSKVVRIDAVSAGAVGVASRVYAIDAIDTAWRVTMRIKCSADYTGNRPWFFLGASNEANVFIAPVELGPTPKITPEWSTVIIETPRGKLPPATAKINVNLATVTNKDQSPTGTLFIDDVVIESLH